MLIVVSPAKKLDMTPREDLEQSQPIFPEQAADLAQVAGALSQAQLQKLMGISEKLAQLNQLANLTDFVTDLNFMINKLTELTYRGSPGSDDTGPLADDTLVKGYLRSFKRMTTTPLPGFQDQTLYLSNFGVMTELDGSVSINETKFEEFFTANPDAFSAITNTRAVSDSNLVQAELSGSLWKTGIHTNPYHITLQYFLPFHHQLLYLHSIYQFPT